MQSSTTEGRIIGHMVTRNERSRYLSWALSSMMSVCDNVVVYDDDSDDGTYEFLKAAHVFVRRRLGVRPSFAEDESGFRSVGWRFMEQWAKPTEDDWVLCLDADEVLVTNEPDIGVRGMLDRAILEAQRSDIDAICFGVDEVFDVREDGPWIRTDGFWGQIQACRLVRWRPDGVWDPRRLAGGSVPTGWVDWRFVSDSLRILHFGYAKAEDRKARFERYRNRTGHNSAHIESILSEPALIRWPGDPSWMYP